MPVNLNLEIILFLLLLVSIPLLQIYLIQKTPLKLLKKSYQLYKKNKNSKHIFIMSITLVSITISYQAYVYSNFLYMNDEVNTPGFVLAMIGLSMPIFIIIISFPFSMLIKSYIEDLTETKS